MGTYDLKLSNIFYQLILHSTVVKTQMSFSLHKDNVLLFIGQQSNQINFLIVEKEKDSYQLKITPS